MCTIWISHFYYAPANNIHACITIYYLIVILWYPCQRNKTEGNKKKLPLIEYSLKMNDKLRFYCSHWKRKKNKWKIILTKNLLSYQNNRRFHLFYYSYIFGFQCNLWIGNICCLSSIRVEFECTSAKLVRRPNVFRYDIMQGLFNIGRLLLRHKDCYKI